MLGQGVSPRGRLPRRLGEWPSRSVPESVRRLVPKPVRRLVQELVGRRAQEQAGGWVREWGLAGGLPPKQLRRLVPRLGHLFISLH